MSITVGTRVDSYEIVASLGSGGMGEVYRARDTKLGRDVALKILPEAFAGDADRLARFEREAKAAAESYREEFRRSQDPLVSLIRRVGGGASGTVGDWVGFGISHPCTAVDKWNVVLLVDDRERIVAALPTFF